MRGTKPRNLGLAVLVIWAVVAAPFDAAGQSGSDLGTVAGRVVEAATGRGIGSAGVAVVGTQHRTLTGADGGFVIRDVPVGRQSLHVGSIGYGDETVELEVAADGTARADVSLTARAISIEGIVVTPGRFGVMAENAAAPQTLGREVIETMPGLGEDIYRMVHRLPGVAADDYSAKFAVRGGGHEELLVRLDGLTLYEPFHLKDLDGALSIVDVQAVGGVDLTTGGFSAEYGSRLTGVFDMRTVREPTERTRTSAGISLTNARLMSVGGFAGNRGSWLVSARRGYLDVLLKMVDEGSGFTPRYHDVLGKVEYQFSPRNIVSASVLSAGDALTMSDDHFTLRSTYGNHYGWVNWRAYPTDEISVQTVVSMGGLDWMRRVDGGAAGTEITGLTLDDERDFRFAGIQQDWTWRASDNHLLKWGGGYRTSAARYDYERTQSGEASGGRPLPPIENLHSAVRPTGAESGGYLTHRMRVAAPLTTELGVRVDHYSQSGEAVVGPRANAALALDSRVTVRAAWGLYHQPQELYQLHVQDGDPDFYRAERAEHRVLGVDYTAGRGVTVRAEAYQRVLSRMRPRYANLFNVNSGIEEAAPDRIRLAPTEGEAHGLELFASNDPRSALGWYASYTYARIDDVIDGEPVPRGLDQRHSALFELRYRPTSRWSVSTSWQIRTGRPYTSSALVATLLPNGETEYAYDFGEPFGERLAPYHRLDLRVTRRMDVGRNQIAVFVDVFNLYDRANPRGWSSSLEAETGGTVRLEEGPVMNLPRLPSIGLSWEF